MINLNNIFELFSFNEDLEGVNEELYSDLTSNPIYWVGMYNKIILNHVSFAKRIKKFLEDINHPLDESDVKDAGEYMVYHRAWSYISNIDINDKSHELHINKYKDKSLIITLSSGIKFFEKFEDYEKCAFLKNILDILK